MLKRLSSLLLITLYALNQQVSAQEVYYVSKPSGGFWEDTATWQGGRKPVPGSDVLLTGPVTVQGSITCRNLFLSPQGSLSNLTGTCASVMITDTLYNEGLITNNVPDYWCYGERLTLVLKGHILRLGRFKPTRLYLNDSITHHFYNPGHDTIWSYVEFLDSSVLACHDPFIIGNRVINAIVDLNKNPLVAVAGSSLEYDYSKKPYRSTILNAWQIYAEKGSLIGNNETDKFNIYGDSLCIHGYFTSAGISFYGNVFNYDTMANYGEKWKAIYGNLTNTGAIVNNTGWHVSHSIMVSGNILNTGSWFTAWLILSGKNPRNVRLNSGVSDAVYFLDSMILTGYNTLPGLRPYPWSNQVICTIAPDATLVISNPEIDPGIVSYGHIRSSNSNSDTWYDLPLPHASIRRKNGSNIASIQCDSYSRQHHPFVKSGLKHWWIFKNTPKDYNDLLEYASFGYTDDEAEGLDESLLKAFYSVDGGLTWKWCSSYFVNPSSNYIRVNNIPSAAQIVFSTDRIDTLLSATAAVSSVSPKKIASANNNPSLLTITGKGFTSSTRVFFRNKEKVLVPDTVMLSGLHGTSLLVVLRPEQISKPEFYDLVLQNPGQPDVILPSAIEVNPLAFSFPWFVLGGRDRTLANRWQTFEFSYGNAGTADIWGVPVFFAIKEQPGMEVAFPDFTPKIPAYAHEMEHAFLEDSSLFFLVDSLFEEPGPWRIYGFYIPNIPAATSEASRIKIKAPFDIDLQAWMIQPYNPAISFTEEVEVYKDGSQLNACLTAFAMKSFAMNIVGQIPGVGCVSNLADKYFDPVGYITGTDQNNENSWGSILWSASSWVLAIGDCAADIVPVAKAVKIAAGIASFMADIKENYDADQKCRNKYKTKRLRTRTVFSVDPNEKTGNPGAGNARFVNTDMMSYTIHFENLATATSSALEVGISDTLNKEVFDLAKLRFTGFSFGDTLISLNEDTLFVSRLIDLSPEKDILLSFMAEADTATGIVRWAFRSLDRITGELTEDPDAGFLPPNVSSPDGEGYVSFTVPLRHGLPDNTVISNQATIVFDLNKPISTNVFSNVLDNTPPVSDIHAAYLQNDTTIVVSVNGEDAASGIASFIITVAHNDGEPVPWTTLYLNREARFVPPDNGTWKFFCRAVDFADNYEPAGEIPSAQVTVSNLSTPSTFSGSFSIYPNPARSKLFIHSQNIEIMHYEIISSEGLCMKKGYLKQEQEEIDISSLPAGIYLVKIVQKNTVVTRKLVVQ